MIKLMKKKVAIFEGFPIPESFHQDYLIVNAKSDDLKDCDDFLIPIDQKLSPMVDMFYFSSTFFGSLHLSFDLDKTKIVSSDFVGSLLNSPPVGKFQRLHFYVHNRRGLSDKAQNSLKEAIEMKSELIKGRPWCENLLPFIEIPNHSSIIQSDPDMIFVKDRFPKGSVHFLCIPKKRIDTWWFLTPEDIPLLLKMQEEVEKFAKNYDPQSEFVFGFHTIPSMKQLHLHVVNKDFNSPILTYPQWNAFNTNFLVSVHDVIVELKEKGRIEMPQERWNDYWALLSVPLKCNICKRTFRKLEALKNHYYKEYTASRNSSK